MTQFLALAVILSASLVGLSAEARQQSVALASWYGAKAHQGKLTANGERFDSHKLTAASKTLPFGCVLRLVNLANNHEVQVRVNDRGPFVKGRDLDLSLAAAKVLGMQATGLAWLTVYRVRHC